MFDDGLFRVSHHNTARARPHMWPKSVSEMRHHTSYSNQGMKPASPQNDRETAYSDRVAQCSRAQCCRARCNSARCGDAQCGSACAPPYTQQSQYYMPFWQDVSHPRNQGNWQGHGGWFYEEPSTRRWFQMSDGARQ